MSEIKTSNNPDGRPPSEKDQKSLEASMSLGGSLEFCADLLQVSQDTIERYVKEKYGMGFIAAREKLMSTTKLKLKQKAISKAFDGDNTMLIWCLKNLCGWSDKLDHTSSDGSLGGSAPVRVVISLPANGREAKEDPKMKDVTPKKEKPIEYGRE